MNNKMLFVDYEKCTGCKRCELACSYYNKREYNPLVSRIRIVDYEDICLRIPMSCVECEERFCKDVCPTGAIEIKEGIARVNENKCIGCKQCLLACPFGGISYDYEKGKAFKCDLCEGDPECVKNCQFDAIKYIDIDEAIMDKKKSGYRKIIEKKG